MSILIEILPSSGTVLIVGAGNIGLRRARLFIDAGFAVTVVAPTLIPGFADLPIARIVLREFEDADISGHALVCACTSVRGVNAHIGELARKHRIPVVVADRQAESTFFMPAIHRDGSLVVGVGTAGASPRLAAELRDRVATCLGEGWASRIEDAREERQRSSLGDGGPS